MKQDRLNGLLIISIEQETDRYVNFDVMKIFKILKPFYK